MHLTLNKRVVNPGSHRWLNAPQEAVDKRTQGLPGPAARLSAPAGETGPPGPPPADSEGLSPLVPPGASPAQRRPDSALTHAWGTKESKKERTRKAWDPVMFCMFVPPLTNPYAEALTPMGWHLEVAPLGGHF